MKPAPFTYLPCKTLDQALDYLTEYGYDAKILAGGQSLIPTMNFRMAQPKYLVDINTIDDLSYIKPGKKGAICIGAMTRHYELEKSDIVSKSIPMITQAMPFIAHSQIRNRGTIGGSIAHTDPAAELPAMMVALNAKFKLRSKKGERFVDAKDFFVGLFATVLEPNEILIEIQIPAISKRTGTSFLEVSRRLGDFALVGVAVSITVNRKGKCEDIKVVFCSVGEMPTVAEKAQELLKGEILSDELIEKASEVASKEDVEPTSDIHASSEYRRNLVKVLATKAIKEAYTKATS